MTSSLDWHLINICYPRIRSGARLANREVLHSERGRHYLTFVWRTLPPESTNEYVSVAVAIGGFSIALTTAYAQPNAIFNSQWFEDIIRRTPHSHLLSGDANGHRLPWDDMRINADGQPPARLVRKYDLSVSNDGSSTYVSGAAISCFLEVTVPPSSLAPRTSQFPVSGIETHGNDKLPNIFCIAGN